MLNNYVCTNGTQLRESCLRNYENYRDQINNDSESVELEICDLLLDIKHGGHHVLEFVIIITI
jgi:hypothetical protein